MLIASAQIRLSAMTDEIAVWIQTDKVLKKAQKL
jgi:hypothetical protein